MKFGALQMPPHPPERSIRDGLRWDINDLERLDALGFDEAWIGEHFTATWEPCPAPDLLIAQALLSTKQIRLGPMSHLFPFHYPVELAHRVAYLDHMAEGRYQVGVGIGVLPTDHDLFALDVRDGQNRRMTFEAIDMMTRFWIDGASDFQGEFWSMGETREGAARSGHIPDRNDWRIIRDVVYVAPTDAEARELAIGGIMDLHTKTGGFGHLTIVSYDASDEARERIKVDAPPTQNTSWGARLFQIRDPDGVPVTFLQWTKTGIEGS